jgi:hypothetical protein
MRVKDVKHSAYFRLKALPWHTSYLAAMWILCGELQTLYADSIDADEIPLMTSTMDLVREVITLGESLQAGPRAAELTETWGEVIAARDDQEGSDPGLLNALATFEALAQEIVGLSGKHDAANWAMNAAEGRWRDWDQPGPILVDRDEEVDDSSPMAQTLELFGRVASEVTAMQGPDWDPVRIRTQIFGQR